MNMAYVIFTPTNDIKKSIQNYLFSKGFVWVDGTNDLYLDDHYFLYIDINFKKISMDNAFEYVADQIKNGCIGIDYYNVNSLFEQ